MTQMIEFSWIQQADFINLAAMSFDTDLLQAFVAVHQANGFTRAAEQLHLTQSAVSHQIRRLEELVGRPLFHRTTRRLSLTADGEDFLRHAERILRAQERAGAALPPLAHRRHGALRRARELHERGPAAAAAAVRAPLSQRAAGGEAWA